MNRTASFYLTILFVLSISMALSQNRWGSPLTFGATYHGGHFYDSFFRDSGIGWAWGIGESSILHTTDKGESWIPQIIPSTSAIANVFFVSDSIGWGVGSNGLIVHTTDAGFTWNIQVINTTSNLNAVYFKNQDTGWVVGNNVYGKTVDGGLTWQRSFNSISNPRKIVMVSNNKGWILNGNLYQTVNGGQNWNQVYPNSIYSFNDIAFLDSLNGWIIGGGQILKTTNSGQTWQAYTLPSTSLPTAPAGIQFSTLTKGWALAVPSTTSGGNCRIFETSDGGATWYQIYSTSESLKSFYIKENDFGVVFGLEGFLAISGDGGLTWQNRTEKFPMYLQDVFFLNSNLGWLSTNRHLYKSENGGLDWQQIQYFPNTSVNKILFTSDSIGYALCDYYIGGGPYTKEQLLKTYDGGNTWQILIDTATQNGSGNIFNLREMFFINDTVGWLSSNFSNFPSHWIKKTTDGGYSWTTLTTDYGSFNIDFVSPLEGWLVF
jgi:photosystem II stability/assembly factor-like uncharacterized protein